jgi:hypothetical protein
VIAFEQARVTRRKILGGLINEYRRWFQMRVRSNSSRRQVVPGE